MARAEPAAGVSGPYDKSSNPYGHGCPGTTRHYG